MRARIISLLFFLTLPALAKAGSAEHRGGGRGGGGRMYTGSWSVPRQAEGWGRSSYYPRTSYNNYPSVSGRSYYYNSGARYGYGYGYPYSYGSNYGYGSGARAAYSAGPPSPGGAYAATGSGKAGGCGVLSGLGRLIGGVFGFFKRLFGC